MCKRNPSRDAYVLARKYCEERVMCSSCRLRVGDSSFEEDGSCPIMGLMFGDISSRQMLLALKEAEAIEAYETKVGY